MAANCSVPRTVLGFQGKAITSYLQHGLFAHTSWDYYGKGCYTAVSFRSRNSRDCHHVFTAGILAEVKLGIEVIVQNPKAIARFKGLFEEDKTDTIDARRIADFLRLGLHRSRFHADFDDGSRGRKT